MGAIDTDEAIPTKCHSLRLRSIRKRMETERNKNLPKTRKPRERPAPLSKYRRRTANARERQRMHEVNVAFERLKATIPHHRLKQIDEKKDTKITTLRCAITYINSLSELLDDLEDGKSVSPEYYFTDAQLGLETPSDVKKGNKKSPNNKKKPLSGVKKPSSPCSKKAAGKAHLNQGQVSKATSAATGLDLNHALNLLSALPAEAKVFNNRRKKVNPSAPFMIDNRPEKKTGGRKGGSGGLAAAGIIQQSTTALAAGGGSTAENVLQALIINNNCGVTLKPKDLNVILSSQKPTLLPPKGSQLPQGGTHLRGPVVPEAVIGGRPGSHQSHSRPPAAVLALAQAMTSEDPVRLTPSGLAASPNSVHQASPHPPVTSLHVLTPMSSPVSETTSCSLSPSSSTCTFSSATSTPDKTFLGDSSVTHSAHPFPDKAVGLQGSTPFTVVDSGVLSGHGIDDLTPSLDFSHSGLDIGQFLNLDS